MRNAVSINELIGKVIKTIIQDDNEWTFRCDDGSEYRMYHEQDCCECVEIKEIHGDIRDLIDSPIYYIC